MPLPLAALAIPAVAVFVRVVIQAAVQTGILVAVSKLISPLTDAAKNAYARAFDLTAEEAEDSLANDVIDVLATLGIIGVSIRTKLPTVVAEKLGFSSKGFAMRPLSAKAQAAKSKLPKTNVSNSVATAGEVEEIASTVAKGRGINIGGVRSLLTIIATVVGVPTGFFFALAQYIDFANWQGPYQKTFQNLLSKIGINPDTPMPKASVVSADIWKRIYSTIEELGPRGLSFPFSGVDKIYSRENLADLVDEVSANLVKSGGQASYKNVIALVLPLTQLGGSPVTGSGSSTANLIAAQSFSGTSDVRVFSGIVSQGVLGTGLSFIPRPDDLIESMSELESAMKNNIAPYLSTLLGKIIYEIKVVPSVIIGNLTRKGEIQTIITGYTSAGVAKKKSVVNKFAVADIFVINDTGNRVRVKRVVLGPTDAVKFQPDPVKLSELATVVSKDIVTTNPDDIGTVVSNTPTESKTKTSTREDVYPDRTKWQFEFADGQRGDTTNSSRSGALRSAKALAKGIGKSLVESSLRLDDESVRATGRTDIGSTSSSSAGASPPSATTASKGGQTPDSATPASSLPMAALTAPNLSEFYGAQGKQLPSLAERGRLYQSLGLGQEAFYTGTAEQNTKLLRALQGSPL